MAFDPLRWDSSQGIFGANTTPVNMGLFMGGLNLLGGQGLQGFGQGFGRGVLTQSQLNEAQAERDREEREIALQEQKAAQLEAQAAAQQDFFTGQPPPGVDPQSWQAIQGAYGMGGADAAETLYLEQQKQAMKGPELTGPQKDAAALGYKPGSKEYRNYILDRTLPKAAQTNVNVNMPGTTAQEEVYIEALKPQYQAYGEAAQSAQTVLPLLDQAEMALNQIMAGGGTTGLTEETVLPLRRIMANMGFNVENLAAQEVLQSAQSQLALKSRPSGSGTMSDRDLEVYEATAPGLGKTPAANRMLIQTKRHEAQSDILFQQKMLQQAKRGEHDPSRAWREVRQEMGSPYSQQNMADWTPEMFEQLDPGTLDMIADIWEEESQ